MFVLVGLTGVFVHLSLLSLLYAALELPFLLAQGLATYAAMISNFCLNNRLTYRDQRLKGGRFFLGLLSFCAICSVGAFLNLLVAGSLFDHRVPWAAAGVLGSMVGAVWNYGVTSCLTWRVISPRAR
jgi:dolichol-phosphate mannosyltransferase